MRGGLTASATDALQARVDTELDRRLDRPSRAPVALGLSGGSDSLALLHLAADWCARAGRPLLALTVDHALHPDSPDWTARAGGMAAEAGAGWRAPAWTGPKPAAGLPAAARAARHALLADAARGAGAAVILLAHTADDLAETEALRAGDAPGVGRLRSWAPSPAWPQGRGVFLLRPLLGVPRGALRAWLRERGRGWLEDPANADLRFARARLRARGFPPPPSRGEPPGGFGEAGEDGVVRLPRARLGQADAAARRTLSAAVACAAGMAAGPRGRGLDGLLARLAGRAPVAATLGGARIAAEADTVAVGRDPGRAPPRDLLLTPGAAVVWDGRFEALAREPSWRIGLADGRRARLSPVDRERLRAVPPALRGARPVLLRGEGVRLVADEVVLRALAPARFDAAVGRIACEADLRAGGSAAGARTIPCDGTTGAAARC